MKKILNFIARTILLGTSSLAMIMTIISINATCCGPGYQPKYPQSMDKFKKY